jgi:hypothetical protein
MTGQILEFYSIPCLMFIFIFILFCLWHFETILTFETHLKLKNDFDQMIFKCKQDYNHCKFEPLQL